MRMTFRKFDPTPREEFFLWRMILTWVQHIHVSVFSCMDFFVINNLILKVFEEIHVYLTFPCMKTPTHEYVVPKSIPCAELEAKPCVQVDYKGETKLTYSFKRFTFYVRKILLYVAVELSESHVNSTMLAT